MGQLDNKIALVTGASTGIGLGIAERFVKEGATVYITGRRENELKAAAERLGDRAVPVRGDVSDLDDIDRLVAGIRDRAGRLDILVANAGGGELARLGDITEEDYDRTFAINVKGIVFTTQKALPLLDRGGSIILLASTNASKGVPAMSVYSATKAAIRSLARSWAGELAERGIRVNAVSPGPVETPGILSLAGDNPAARRRLTESLIAQVPLGRMGRADEVAALALFLASDESSFSTGGEFFVDGGLAQI